MLGQISPELYRHRSDRLWQSLHALDNYRARFDSAPATLTNPILLGSLVVPTGLLPGQQDASLTLGALPVAKGQVASLRQIISLQRRLGDSKLPERTTRRLTRRSVFAEALTWLEIHGDAPETVKRWRSFVANLGEPPVTTKVRRRRRRRRKPRSTEE